MFDPTFLRHVAMAVHTDRLRATTAPCRPVLAAAPDILTAALRHGVDAARVTVDALSRVAVKRLGNN